MVFCFLYYPRKEAAAQSSMKSAKAKSSGAELETDHRPVFLQI